MRDEDKHSLTQVLDRLDELTDQDKVSVQQIVEKLGSSSFASLMLIFTLISTSPASAIPGLTALIGIIVATLVLQMIIGKKTVWLPGFLMKRQFDAAKLHTAVAWLRKPVGWVQHILRRRLTFLLHRPLFLVPLTLILCLALFMPAMELVPASGSIASAVIALFAAGLLMRDGLLIILSMALMSAIPVLIWQIGFGGV
ncbi:exopolysaccharide biosynthesis protein [Falsirhodobacter sp. alg1]|uniref:exopolysaccharide biosynthesis protein n=1 Tax=Falsirhodobacter sp. alg1 TaxID=1472418 RepID=UPI0005EEE30C|nr:exopolysaccharide biosynthesis protein [Falsirhodobacter sp. alg1]